MKTKMERLAGFLPVCSASLLEAMNLTGYSLSREGKVGETLEFSFLNYNQGDLKIQDEAAHEGNACTLAPAPMPRRPSLAAPGRCRGKNWWGQLSERAREAFQAL